MVRREALQFAILTTAWLGFAHGSELDTNGVPVPTRVSAASGFHDASLIDDLAGRWSGTGSALYTDGTSEKLHCVATYAAAAGSNGLHQNIRCTGSNMELKLGGDWSVRNGAIAGTWTEETYSLAGKLTGHAVPTGFDLSATSTFADASVAVRIKGCAQDIVMSFTQQVDKMRLTLHKC